MQLTFIYFLAAPSWVPCLFARPRNFPQQHISKRFVFPGNNISGTNRFHVNKLPHHRGPNLPIPNKKRKSHRKNVFFWGPPFVGPKNARFGHGFEKNLIKNLVSLSLPLCVKFLGVHHAVNIQIFWPLRGFHVCFPGPEISHSNIFQKVSFSLATTLVVQTGSM